MAASDFYSYMMDYIFANALNPTAIAKAEATNLGGIYYLDLELTED